MFEIIGTVFLSTLLILIAILFIGAVVALVLGVCDELTNGAVTLWVRARLLRVFDTHPRRVLPQHRDERE